MSEHDRVPAMAEQDMRKREMRIAPQRSARERQAASGDFREYDLLLRESPPRAIAITQQALAILVRLLGLTVLVIGVVVAAVILREAWNLYQDPARIERFAVAIERGSNLDQIFSLATRESAEEEVAPPEGAEPSPAGTAAAAPAAGAGARHLRLSYFAAWFLVLLLLFVTSVIALSAVSAGGRLVLYDTDVRALTRAVVREVRRGRAERAGD